jgi:hypothetical protein
MAHIDEVRNRLSDIEARLDSTAAASSAHVQGIHRELAEVNGLLFGCWGSVLSVVLTESVLIAGKVDHISASLTSIHRNVRSQRSAQAVPVEK